MPSCRMRQYGHITIEQKLAAIKRIKAGETKASVSRSIDVPESTLRGWCKNVERIQLAADGTKSSKSPINAVRNDRPKYNYKVKQNLMSSRRPNRPHEVKDIRDRDMIALDLTKSTQPLLSRFAESSALQKFMDISNNGSESNGLCTSHVDPKFNVPKDANCLNGNKSTNIYAPIPIPSPVLPSQKAPLMATPSGLFTTQTNVSRSTLNGHTRRGTLLWRPHELIDRVADKQTIETKTVLKISFNNSDELRNSPQIATKMDYVCPEPKATLMGERNELCDNFNNKCVGDEEESDSGLLEAIHNAEKFSEWFKTYSDPTITTQDAMRFERLLEKVKKINARKSTKF